MRFTGQSFLATMAGLPPEKIGNYRKTSSKRR
jgi:hypothetical protein